MQCGLGDHRLTKAMQKTERARATVTMTSLNALGYSKFASSSSSDVVATAASSGVFSGRSVAATGTARSGSGSAEGSRSDEGAADAAMSLVSTSLASTLATVVVSESATLMGRSMSLFGSLMAGAAAACVGRERAGQERILARLQGRGGCATKCLCSGRGQVL